MGLKGRSMAIIPAHDDPLRQLERQEAALWRRRRGCIVCVGRPRLVGGEGYCKNMGMREGCGFRLDEKAIEKKGD